MLHKQIDKVQTNHILRLPVPKQEINQVHYQSYLEGAYGKNNPQVQGWMAPSGRMDVRQDAEEIQGEAIEKIPISEEGRFEGAGTQNTTQNYVELQNTTYNPNMGGTSTIEIERIETIYSQSFAFLIHFPYISCNSTTIINCKNLELKCKKILE